MNRLTDLIRSKTSTLLSKNQFDIDWSKNSLADSDLLLAVDQDAFAQIVINLVDNAIKFSIIKEQPDKTIRKLEVGFKNYDKKTATVVFFVRDFGPGIDPKQCKKVFDLFYRIGNEMTRTTPGTGIGLALVNELAHAMNGQVAMVNLQPGIEAQVILPVASKRK